MFISWIQSDYNKHIDYIHKNFEYYRQQRSQNQNGQERISQHGFIMRYTSYLLHRFFAEKGYNEYDIISKNKQEIMKLCKKQETLMRESALKSGKKDFCRTFAELYMTKKLTITNINDFWEFATDGFMLNKHTICMRTAILCQKMQSFYNDKTITIQEVTKQLRGNRFLITDNSISSKSTKKVGNVRYLHISKEAVEDYYKYCCQ